MYEIKTTSGTILYVAADSTTVRSTLEAAVATGANLGEADLGGADLRWADLREADLRWANLGGANLGGANLRGADLRWANLGEADLRWANLGGANLGGANLRGADLRWADLGEADLGGANLRGADLRWANLRGADLREADLGGDIWIAVAEKLTDAIQAMNDNGRHWIKGKLSRILKDGSEAYCAVGSLQACISDGTIRTIARWLLDMTAGGSVVSFNDYEETTWEDVQRLFFVAIQTATRFSKS